MPTWAQKALNPGLLAPLIKKAAPPGVTLDSRQTNARGSDVSVWAMSMQRAHAPVVAGQLGPQKLGVSVKDGAQVKVLGGALLMEKARQSGKPYVQIALDLSNAHSDYGRKAAQERLVAL